MAASGDQGGALEGAAVLVYGDVNGGAGGEICGRRGELPHTILPNALQQPGMRGEMGLRGKNGGSDGWVGGDTAMDIRLHELCVNLYGQRVISCAANRELMPIVVCLQAVQTSTGQAGSTE